MLTRLLHFVAVACTLAGTALAQTSLTDSIYAGGQYRKFILYVPAIYNASSPTPLVINMHGLGSNMMQQQLYGNFMPIADTANFLVVHPQGTTLSGQTFWNAGFGASFVDDVSFLSNLIDSLKLGYNIDLNRVYSTGMSNGGYMSHTLACSLSNRIAAIASVTGSMVIPQYNSCNPGRPVPVMQIHGTADPTVPYNGNASSAPIDSVVNYWRRNAQCNPTPQFSNVPNTNTSDGCTAEHYVYTGGLSGTTIELYKVIGGEHTWPGSPFIIGVTNQDFSASVEIWRFFRRYRLNQLTSVNEPDQLADLLRIYPNPSNGLVQLAHPSHVRIESVQVTDLTGKVLETQLYKGSVNLEGYAPGIYFLGIKANDNFIVKKVLKE